MSVFLLSVIGFGCVLLMYCLTVFVCVCLWCCLRLSCVTCLGGKSVYAVLWKMVAFLCLGGFGCCVSV